MDIEQTNELLSTETLAFMDEFYGSKMNDLTGDLQRLQMSNYKNLSEKFIVKQKLFNKQYTHLYFSRLFKLRTKLVAKLEAMKHSPSKVIDVKKNSRVAVTGTLYKEMKFKPNVLQKMNTDTAMGQNKFKSFIAEDDYMFIEDDTARAKLEFHENSVYKCKELSVNDKNASPAGLITGMVVGIVGVTNERGTIQVDEVIFDDTLTQEQKQPYYNFIKEAKILGHNDYTLIKNVNSIEKYITSASKDDKYIALVSGLNLYHNSSQFPFRMLKSFLFGGMTSSPMAKLASRIMRVVFAGDMIAEQNELMVSLQGAFKMQEIFTKLQQETSKALRQLDDFLSEIAEKVAVDVMPGEQDPSDDRIPQQPLNQSYFPNAYAYTNLTAVTNPYEFELDNVRLLGTAGQNVKDIMQYASISPDAIEVMKCNILWRHIAPTAPDTLNCHCFTDGDPFVLTELPHVYFAGNQERFDTKVLVNERDQTICRLVAIPVFSKSCSIVLVNLKNLDAFEVHFGVEEENEEGNA